MGSRRRGGSLPQPGVVEVRAGRAEDAADLALLHVRAWQAAYPGLMPRDYLDGLDVAERTAGWQRRLVEQTDEPGLLLAVVAQQVVGFASFGAARDAESGDAGELYALNVHPDHWRAGVGSALLTAAHAGLSDLGHDRAVLWVVPGNERARRFYERHGWVLDDAERVTEESGVTVPEIRYARELS